MKAVINPDMERIRTDRWFLRRAELWSLQPGFKIRSHHASIGTRGDAVRCRICYDYMEAMSVEGHLNEATHIHMHFVDIMVVLDAGPHKMEIWENAAGIWHAIKDAGETVMTPYPHLSAHEVLEALEAAEADPTLGCPGFAQPITAAGAGE